MKTQYIVKGFHAFTEKDSFENGCIGPAESKFVEARDWECKADTLTGLMAKLADEFKSSDFLLDSCEEEGRLDLQANQRQKFIPAKPSEASINDWKNGLIDLWLTCYTFNVVRVTSEIDLTALHAEEAANILKG